VIKRSTPTSGTANAVLGLLSFGQELSGYDLKKWADNSLSLFYWSPAMSQIYAELRRLEDQGLVTSREVRQDDRRNKRLYRITDAGNAALAAWLLDEPVEGPILKHPVLLRVWLGHLVPPDQLRSVIDTHRTRTEAKLEELSLNLERVAREESWAYPELIIRWVERYYKAERENATQLLAEFDAMQWDAPSRSGTGVAR
jgi:DNA-binding PadR family transcriptional regulator